VGIVVPAITFFWYFRPIGAAGATVRPVGSRAVK
jgi:hypothetical protein